MTVWVIGWQNRSWPDRALRQPFGRNTKLAAQLGVQGVFANHDDEPAAWERDAAIRGRLSNQGVALYTCKDHVIFERNEILTGQGTPTACSPPTKRLAQKVDPFYLKAYPIAPRADRLATVPADLAGWQGAPLLCLPKPTSALKPARISKCLAAWLARTHCWTIFCHGWMPIRRRDFPSVKGPSYLSTHLRFGTVSIRHLANLAWNSANQGSNGAQVWLSELIWRDFYHQILFHHPRVVGSSYKREYDKIKVGTRPSGHCPLQSLVQRADGLPLVDAAMRQLNQTGYMHNRLRMVVASFLTKDLGIDWRRGEAYFAEKLLTLTWLPTMAAGNGRHPRVVMHNPTSDFQPNQPKQSLIQPASSSGAMPELADIGCSHSRTVVGWFQACALPRAHRASRRSRAKPETV